VIALLHYCYQARGDLFCLVRFNPPCNSDLRFQNRDHMQLARGMQSKGSAERKENNWLAFGMKDR